MLSPFFAKSDGLLLIDLATRSRIFRANVEKTGQSTCDLVLDTGIPKLICGFIADTERERLLAAGVDVRIGSCARRVSELARSFDALPKP